MPTFSKEYLALCREAYRYMYGPDEAWWQVGAWIGENGPVDPLLACALEWAKAAESEGAI